MTVELAPGGGDHPVDEPEERTQARPHQRLAARRIRQGSVNSTSEVNNLLNQFKQMKKMDAPDGPMGRMMTRKGHKEEEGGWVDAGGTGGSAEGTDGRGRPKPVRQHAAGLRRPRRFSAKNPVGSPGCRPRGKGAPAKR